MTGLEHAIVGLALLAIGTALGGYLDHVWQHRQQCDDESWLPVTTGGLHRSWDEPIEDVVQAHHDDGHRAVVEAEAWVRACSADGPYDHETEGL